MSGHDLAQGPAVSTPQGPPPLLRAVAPSGSGAGRTPGAPDFTLAPADRDLVDQARTAFRTDFHYLLDVLWQARARQR